MPYPVLFEESCSRSAGNSRYIRAMEGILTAAEVEALALSVRVALVAVLADLPFAFLAALVLARCRFRGKTLFDGIIHLPLVLPPVALGYLLLISFGTRAPLGGFLFEDLCIRFVQVGTPLSRDR